MRAYLGLRGFGDLLVRVLRLRASRFWGVWTERGFEGIGFHGFGVLGFRGSFFGCRLRVQSMLCPPLQRQRQVDGWFLARSLGCICLLFKVVEDTGVARSSIRLLTRLFRADGSWCIAT